MAGYRDKSNVNHINRIEVQNLELIIFERLPSPSMTFFYRNALLRPLIMILVRHLSSIFRLSNKFASYHDENVEKINVVFFMDGKKIKL